jgi:hypothetical protein
LDYYDGIDVHRSLVGDDVRNKAFRSSIAATVRPGDVVLDLGAGSGILSLFAVQAGAARVYALERAPVAAALARQIVASNGFADRVQIVEADVSFATVIEPVNVIVSEWLGVYGVDENMLAAVLLARDRWLVPEGRMIPGVTTAWIAPVFNGAGSEAIAFWAQQYGLDLSALAPFNLDEVVWQPQGARAEDLRADPQPIWSTDPGKLEAGRAVRPFSAEPSFTVSGPVNGLVAWFSAEMPGTEPLTNRPGSPMTHWGNFLFPIANAATAQPADELRVGFHCVPSSLGGSDHLWSSQINDGPREVHDSRRLRRPVSMPPWRISLAE